MMIQAAQHPDTSSPRGARGIAWIAECSTGGQTYSARSRSGAPYALARVLVAAGVPDQPMSVMTVGLAGETRYRSIHRMAGQTIKESATAPVHLEKYREFPSVPSPDALTGD